MNLDEIRKNVLENPKWTERAIVALDDEGYWNDEDRRMGSYIAEWIRNHQNLPAGERVTGDRWEGTARGFALKYINELLLIAYKNMVTKANRLKKAAAKLVLKAEEIEEQADALEHEIELLQEEDFDEQIERMAG